MSHILLFGAGPLPFEPADRHYAVCKRTWQFLQPLLEDGHRVTAVCQLVPGARVEAGPRPHPASWSYQLVRADQLENMAWVQAVHDRVRPDAVAGVGALLPRRAAAKLRTGAPRWLDMFGSAMAEAQARAALEQRSKRGSAQQLDQLIDGFWEAEAAALESGDRFSAVSRRQRLALVGELGCAGRLGAETFGRELVEVIPCALVALPQSSAPGLELRGDTIGSGDFVVLWSGGFNTWVDPQTLFEGLEQAMAREPRLHFVATGGALPEHDSITYRTFRERIAASPHAARFHLMGWIPQPQLAGLYRQADVGINIDLDCYEALLGSRSRLLDWLACGLPAVTTDRTELADEVCRAELGFAVPTGAAAVLADRLIGLAGDPELLRRARERAPAWVQRHYSIDATIGPWRRWAAAPQFAPDAERLREPLESKLGLESEAGAESDLAPIPQPRTAFPGHSLKLTGQLQKVHRDAKRFHAEAKQLHQALHQRNLQVDQLRRELDAGNRATDELHQRLHRAGSELEQLHQRLHRLGTEAQQLHQRLHHRNLDHEAELAAHQRSRTELERVSVAAVQLEKRLQQLEANWLHRIAEWLTQAWRTVSSRLRRSRAPAPAEPEPHPGREP